MLKVKIVNSNIEYDQMFRDYGCELVDSIEEADFVQFTGGADVTPALYGEKNTHSYNDEARDFAEICVFNQALALGKPMAGICRGGQFLNVMSGGKMVQHIDGHANGRQHSVYDHIFEETVDLVTSTHHQMMKPSRAGKVLLTANIVGERDIEAVYYKHTRCLCFQPHPEFNSASKRCTDLYFSYLLQLFEGGF